jgi:hypothetical protein
MMNPVATPGENFDENFVQSKLPDGKNVQRFLFQLRFRRAVRGND